MKMKWIRKVTIILFNWTFSLFNQSILFFKKDVNLEDMVELTMDEFEQLCEDNDKENNDDSILTIDKHDGAVFSVDSFGSLLATGGEDDKAYIWKLVCETQNSVTPSLLLETEKFADSVTNLRFSHDGKYLAVSDMSGNIRVYQVDTLELFWCYDTETDIESLNWHPSCNVLFCGTVEGQFMMFKISTNEIKIMYNGDNSSLSCFKILNDGKQVQILKN